ncbi:hypothetical protein AB0G60_33205 [Streptomyces angustmyceticus]|uniref:Uncharacterized protein n=1 Tax=Streptomyces angustmyceticus TaxID=285578 RepID=A0A5J4LK31_9ACTN|nr:hypothetical protein [Streptomyces angustmyceticus]UAL69862.1 hypothetical protein K7396_27665 [Streptomyces angustmyceticus]GES34467.1 hypothetical protein San01_69550 [Streptomyces angustmyceticus]
MNPPPQQAPQPPAPRRRPYGSVRLPAPLPLAPSEPRPGADGGARRWYGPRIALPPLSITALRRHG